MVSFCLQRDRPLWSEDDLHALSQIARYAGIALEHGLSYQAARESAMVLQRSLLTDPPTLPGLQICARYRPAGRDEVGGDWYDAFLRRPDQLAVVIGDGVGHDITAAAAMGHLRATLRGLALDRCEGPATILDRLAAINTRLAITPFATLLYANLTRTDDHWTIRWASAGHPPRCSSHPAVLNCWSGSPAPPWSPPRLRRAPRLRSPCPLDRPCCSTPTA
jgi:serine phosphatase RsbU (regulator of sigma subunit)